MSPGLSLQDFFQILAEINKAKSYREKYKRFYIISSQIKITKLSNIA